MAKELRQELNDRYCRLLGVDELPENVKALAEEAQYRYNQLNGADMPDVGILMVSLMAAAGLTVDTFKGMRDAAPKKQGFEKGDRVLVKYKGTQCPGEFVSRRSVEGGGTVVRIHLDGDTSAYRDIPEAEADCQHEA